MIRHEQLPPEHAAPEVLSRHSSGAKQLALVVHTVCAPPPMRLFFWLLASKMVCVCVPVLKITGTDAGNDDGVSSGVHGRVSGPFSVPSGFKIKMLNGTVTTMSPAPKVPDCFTSVALLHVRG